MRLFSLLFQWSYPWDHRQWCTITYIWNHATLCLQLEDVMSGESVDAAVVVFAVDDAESLREAAHILTNLKSSAFTESQVYINWWHTQGRIRISVFWPKYMDPDTHFFRVEYRSGFIFRESGSGFVLNVVILFFSSSILFYISPPVNYIFCEDPDLCIFAEKHGSWYIYIFIVEYGSGFVLEVRILFFQGQFYSSFPLLWILFFLWPIC